MKFTLTDDGITARGSAELSNVAPGLYRIDEGWVSVYGTPGSLLLANNAGGNYSGPFVPGQGEIFACNFPVGCQFGRFQYTSDSFSWPDDTANGDLTFRLDLPGYMDSWFAVFPMTQHSAGWVEEYGTPDGAWVEFYGDGRLDVVFAPEPSSLLLLATGLLALAGIAWKYSGSGFLRPHQTIMN